MQKFMKLIAASAISAAALATAAAADDRPATPAERSEVGGILEAAGFTSWRRIEFDRDDRKFEVDDARHADGRVYDVDIRGGRIVKRDLED
jgi:polyisoprenoid-binding protein YceI